MNFNEKEVGKLIQRATELHDQSVGKSDRDLSLAEISERAGLNVAEAYAIYASKGAILRDQMRKIDETVLAGTESDLIEESARDRPSST